MSIIAAIWLFGIAALMFFYSWFHRGKEDTNGLVLFGVVNAAIGIGLLL